MDKDFYKSLNGVTYSEDEIKEYEDLGNLNKKDLMKISGSVKSRFGIDQIKKINKEVSGLLESDEYIEKVIKMRDLKVLNVMLVSGAGGGTMFRTNDYGIFSTIYFTNKRIIAIPINYVNEKVCEKIINKDELLGVRFTNKKVVVENKNGLRIGIKEYFFDKILFLSIPMFAYFGYNYFSGIDKSNIWGFMVSTASLLYLILRRIDLKISDRVQLAFKNGIVWKFLIASDDYKECREYLKRLEGNSMR